MRKREIITEISFEIGKEPNLRLEKLNDVVYIFYLLTDTTLHCEMRVARLEIKTSRTDIGLEDISVFNRVWEKGVNLTCVVLWFRLLSHPLIRG
jgi:hypothetical protein